MPTIEEVLRQKENDLQQLQAEVQALRIAIKIMAEADAQTPIRPTNGKLSQPMMAKAVLAEVGHEMHVKEISQRIKEKFGVEISSGYLAPVIYRQLGTVFYKSEKAPNTFGLPEWQKRSEIPAPFNNPKAVITKTPEGNLIARVPMEEERA